MVGQRGARIRLEIQEGCSSTLRDAAAGGCPQMRYAQRYLLDRRPVLPATVWRIRLVEPDTGCSTVLDRPCPPRHISDCYADVSRKPAFDSRFPRLRSPAARPSQLARGLIPERPAESIQPPARRQILKTCS